MAKDEDFKLLKVQTCFLRVNIHCDGCKKKVKKILQRIEGVYQVIIDAEQQKVSVSGGVGSDTLIKKLVKGGKHAELWSQKANQSQKQKGAHECKNNKGQKPHAAAKNDDNFPFMSEVDDCFVVGDEDDEELNGGDMQLLRAMMLEQQAEMANKGNFNANIANVAKKGNQRQMEQKPTLNIPIQDISSMMNLAGFNGNGSNNYSNILGVGGGYQVQPGSGGGFPFNVNPSSTALMNLQNRHALQQQQQPQMLYSRSPLIPPATTGYYYNGPAHYGLTGPLPFGLTEPVGYGGGANMFSDDYTSICSIM